MNLECGGRRQSRGGGGGGKGRGGEEEGRRRRPKMRWAAPKTMFEGRRAMPRMSEETNQEYRAMEADETRILRGKSDHKYE